MILIMLLINTVLLLAILWVALKMHAKGIETHERVEEMNKRPVPESNVPENLHKRIVDEMHERMKTSKIFRLGRVF